MANWVFQYGTASLGVVVNRISFTQIFNSPRTVVPRQSGIVLQPPKALEKQIQITGRLNGADTTVARDAINSLQAVLVNSGDTSQLRLHDDRFILAQMTKFKTDWLPGVGGAAMNINATFIAANPYFIDDSSFSDVQSLTTAAFSWASLVNTGTVLTPSKIVFTNADSSFSISKITNHTLNRSMTITRVTSPGDEVSINMNSFTIVDSAGADLMANVTGAFFPLAVGSNSLTYEGSAANISIEWNPYYDS